jgi:hypothetical protein
MLRVVVIGHNEALYKEANAAEAITPGHLIALNSSGNAIKHATAGPAAAAGANAQGLVRVAVEQDFFGKGIDDAYAANDQVIYQPLDTGCEWMALLAAGATAVGYNDLVESAGNGTVRKTTITANAIGRACEAVDNSGGGSAARIRIEVL